MLRQGGIIQATVSDPQGGNAKLRPLVIVSPTSDVASAAELVAVAITGRFSEPLATDEVLLPFHPNGQAKSGLRKACVAKCSWLIKIQPADVVKQSGFLGAETLTAILRKVGELKLDQTQGESKSP
jgi:mRNA-degrading endonuclease toxin of MazEF toxin-antitoxin module